MNGAPVAIIITAILFAVVIVFITVAGWWGPIIDGLLRLWPQHDPFAVTYDEQSS